MDVQASGGSLYESRDARPAYKQWVAEQVEALKIPQEFEVTAGTPEGIRWLAHEAARLGVITSVQGPGPRKSVFSSTHVDAGVTMQLPASWTYIDYGRNDPKLWGAPSSRYTADGTLYAWADDVTDASRAKMRFNAQDGTTNRKSHVVDYPVTDDNWPIWPHAFVHGSTGKKGPGKLGKLGPNHAADPVAIEVRGIELAAGDDESDEDKIMERLAAATAARRDDCNFGWFGVVMIQRTDRGERDAPDNEWAIPGGMCDPQDPDVSATLIRELMEETMAGLSPDLPQPYKQGYMEASVRHLYARVKKGVDVYRGYNVLDPRNTNNAWMETVVRAICMNDFGHLLERLAHGSDASKVAMIDVAVNFRTGEMLSATYKGDPIVFYSDHKKFVAAACLALWTA